MVHKTKNIYTGFSNLIKWIFPSCEINISLSYNEIKKTILTAGDWRTISDEELLSRIHNGNETKKLYPLNHDGEIVGRLRIIETPYYYMTEKPSAVVSYKGARAGQIYGLQGICKSLSNNEKAERNDALPDYPMECWQDWAYKIVKSEPMLLTAYLLRLHTLIPDEDLRIWYIGHERCYLSDIKSLLKEKDEIIVVNGSIDYEDDDDIKPSEFEGSLILNDNVILTPKKNSHYSKNNSITLDDIISKFRIPEIKYYDRLEDTMRDVWGEFTEDDEDYRVVGYVNGTAITRYTSIYKKMD